MILVDSSVWIDHLRRHEPALADLLGRAQVVCHPFVIGELALGGLSRRDEIVSALQGLPTTLLTADAEVLAFIERHALWGRGVGYVDVHLLAAVRMTSGVLLWTRDRRLREVAAALGLAAEMA